MELLVGTDGGCFFSCDGAFAVLEVELEIFFIFWDVFLIFLKTFAENWYQVNLKLPSINWILSKISDNKLKKIRLVNYYESWLKKVEPARAT